MTEPVYRIRFHGRGGQGMKTASRILGTALFLEGFEVQDAPRYGAERRGAPLFAYVRASRAPINERGVIAHPDLVVVADETLVPVPAAGVTAGLDAHAVLLVHGETPAAAWRERLALAGPVLTLPGDGAGADRLALRAMGAACAGAAARLLGLVTRACLDRAVRDELAALGAAAVARNRAQAAAGFAAMDAHAGRVQPARETPAPEAPPPDWIALRFEGARIAAPAIHAAATSVLVPTGLWRTLRPVLHADRCRRCWWVCGSFCPDGAIERDERGYPRIDYDHCKGCLVCVAQCPPHALEAVPEADAARAAGGP